MPNRYTAYTFLILVALFARTGTAQSVSVVPALELGAAVMAVMYRAKQIEPVVPDFLEQKPGWSGQLSDTPEDTNDEIERLYGDEEDLDDQSPILLGRTAGLDVWVQGERATFKPSQYRNKTRSKLSQTMRKHNISQIDIQPGQLDIFPNDQSEPPVSIILPFESEPLLPETGIDWLDQSEGLAFVHYQSMEMIAEIAEAAISLRAQEILFELDEQKSEIDSEDQITLFEDLGGQLYATETLPVYSPDSIRVDTRSKMEGIVVELDFGVETIKLHTTQKNEGLILGNFDHLVRKTNGEDGKDSKENKVSDKNESGGSQNDKGEDASTGELSDEIKGEETSMKPLNALRHTKPEASEMPPEAKRQCIKLEAGSVNRESIDQKEASKGQKNEPTQSSTLGLFCCCHRDQKPNSIVLRPDSEFLAKGYKLKNSLK